MKTFTGLSKQGGISLFELVVVVLLVGLLMSFAIERIIKLEVVSEKVSLQQTIGALSSALNLEMAERIVKRGFGSLKELENTNPISYLAEMPYNYIGVKSDSQAGQQALQSWYYDDQKHILVYKVKNIKFFESTLAGTPRVRLKVKLIYRDGISYGQNSRIQGVTVESLDDFHWSLQ